MIIPIVSSMAMSSIFYAPPCQGIERKTSATEYCRYVLNNEADFRRFEKKRDRNGEDEKNRTLQVFQKFLDEHFSSN